MINFCAGRFLKLEWYLSILQSKWINAGKRFSAFAKATANKEKKGGVPPSHKAMRDKLRREKGPIQQKVFFPSSITKIKIRGAAKPNRLAAPFSLTVLSCQCDLIIINFQFQIIYDH